MTTITEQTVRQRSTSNSFDRGKSYYRQGAVFDTVRRGNVLEARCEGSQYKPYQVRVTLDKNSNITAGISIPELLQKRETFWLVDKSIYRPC